MESSVAPASHVPSRGPEFPSTHWSIVLESGSSDPNRALVAVAQLCELYREPILRWHLHQGLSAMEAEDCTHDFLARWLRDRGLRTLSQEGGLFRGWLKICLRNHLRDRKRAEAAAKRGGDLEFVELNDTAVAPTGSGTAADLRLDHEIARAAQARTFHTIRNQWNRSGRGEWFDALSDFVFRTPESGEYLESAERLEVSLPKLRRAVFDLREQFLDEFRKEVSRGVTPDTIADESLYLYRLLVEVPPPFPRRSEPPRSPGSANGSVPE